MDAEKAETASIHYGQKRINFHITRQAHLQDKILIHVEPSGQVVVNAPPDSQQTMINCAVRKRARWIVRQLSEIEEYKGHVFPRAYVSGETHFYLGRRYILKIHPSPQEWVKMQQGKIIVAMPSPGTESAKELLAYWYREHAAQYLLRRLNQIAKDVYWLTVIPPMRLLRMRKQWGSCSPQGTIILNPSLIKAPRECIDYVIFHEICHLQEHNHSPKFYALLTRHMPDWKAYKSKLDAMAEILLTDEIP